MKNRPFIKICGITRKSDLSCAVNAGADAVGFIAFPKSPRYVSPTEVKYILDHVDTKGIQKVAVFVNASLEEIQKYIDVGVDVVQLHGDEDSAFANSVNSEVWRAIRLKDESQIERFQNYPCSKFLIDSFVKDSEIPGGTGHVADWELAGKFISSVEREVFLAGGIKNSNVAEALQEVRPYGIDLSSGVEKSPGIKDEKKIQEFFQTVDFLFS